LLSRPVSLSRSAIGSAGLAVGDSTQNADSERVVSWLVSCRRPARSTSSGRPVPCQAIDGTWLRPGAGGSSVRTCRPEGAAPARCTCPGGAPGQPGPGLVLAGAAGPELPFRGSQACGNAAPASISGSQPSWATRSATTAAAGRTSCTSPTPSPAYSAIAATSPSIYVLGVAEENRAMGRRWPLATR
jgi:hypothetical protein